jgi:cation diffusion facilitator CzcD-associated flavoprotein CzcO
MRGDSMIWRVGELPSVCVIGAGVSGLTACKALGDFGVPHTCFEASDDVGGNWYFQNPNGFSSAYRSLHIDISKPSISFRDFPMSERYPDYPHHTHIFEYLSDYADAFALREHIRFHSCVQRAERAPEGGWRVTLAGDPQGGGGERFDALLVCNGHHWSPRLPEYPGTFDGPQIHSHDYIDPRTPLDLYGKRVLVVGIGNSAVDIVSELARKTISDTVFLSTRSGAYVVPKYLFGKPTDQVVKPNPRVPAGVQRRMGRALQRVINGRMEDFGLPTPNHRFLDAHPTVSSELLGRLGAGDAAAKGDVRELLGDRVRFADGSVEAVDAIVYATGYNISFPFLDPELVSAPENVLPLYKRMFKPGIDDLAFIGLGQAIPTIFPFAELQSKLAARWLSGDWAPPSDEEMRAEIPRDEAFHTGHFVAKPRHTMQLDWYAFERELKTRSIPNGQARARAGAPTGRALAARAGRAPSAGERPPGGDVPPAGGASGAGAEHDAPRVVV